MIIELSVVGPQGLSQVVPKRVADHELLLAVAIEIDWEWEMTGLPLTLPLELKVSIEYPEPSIAVLNKDLLRSLSAGEIHELERISVVDFVRALLVVSRRRRHPRPLEHLSGAS